MREKLEIIEDICMNYITGNRVLDSIIKNVYTIN